MQIALTSMFGELVNSMANADKIVFNFVLRPFDILIVIISAIITILISAFIPAIKASRISPIEAIKNVTDFKIATRKVKTSNTMKKLLGTEVDLARKNMKRVKSKFRITVLALSISFILIFVIATTRLVIVNTVSSLKKQMFGKYGSQTILVMGNYETIDRKSFYEETEEGKKVKTKRKIDKFSIAKFNQEIADLEKELDVKFDGVETLMLGLKLEFKDLKPLDTKLKKNIFPEIMTLKGSAKDNLYKSLKISELKDNQAIIVNEVEILTDKGSLEKRKIFNEKDFENGINIKAYPGYKKTKDVEFNFKKDDIILNKDLKVSPNVNNTLDRLTIVVNEKTFEKLANTFNEESIATVTPIKEKNAQRREELVNKLQDKLFKNPGEGKSLRLISAIDTTAMVGMIETMFNILQLLLFGFLLVIIAIGVTNIFSTIAINIILRSKEFAILQSVGMTKHQMKKMINAESLIVCLKAIIIGIVISLVIVYAIFAFAFKQKLNILEFIEKLNLLAFVISVGLIYLISWISSKYAIYKIEKEDIVVTINKETI